MKRVAHHKALLTLITATCCCLLIGRAPAAPADAEPRPSVVTLRQERLATLREAKNIAERQYASGIGTFEQVERVGHRVIESELALATTPAQRSQILTNAVKEARNQEALAQKRLQAGTATAVESLEAKAYRLDLEIKLADAEASGVRER